MSTQTLDQDNPEETDKPDATAESAADSGAEEEESTGTVRSDAPEDEDRNSEEAAPEIARLNEIESELGTAKENLLRALAETENLRKRAERERQDVSKYAVTGFAREMLPVADNLRRALESVPQELRDDERIATLIEGITLTERELLAAFDRHQIRAVDPLGEKFDHNFHQAMFEVPSDDKPPGTVVKVVQTGYVIVDRLLRPALVGVAAAPKEAAPQPPGQHIDTKA